VGARAAETRDAPTATLSREVGVGATGTHGTSGAALCREMGAGAQVTRGGPRAALNREAGTTSPSPLLCPSVGGQGVVPSRLGCRCLYLAATLLGLPPLHDFDDHDHLDLDYLGIKGLSSICGTHRFLLQSQHSLQLQGMSVR
jgi:hypothetical protein